MCDSENLRSALARSGMKTGSANAYRGAWEKLRKQRDMSDAVDALCDAQASIALLQSAYPNENTRQAAMAKCEWPFDNIPELADHPARAAWSAANEAVKRERKARTVESKGVDWDADYAALQLPTRGGGKSVDMLAEDGEEAVAVAGAAPASPPPQTERSADDAVPGPGADPEFAPDCEPNRNADTEPDTDTETDTDTESEPENDPPIARAPPVTGSASAAPPGFDLRNCVAQLETLCFPTDAASQFKSVELHEKGLVSFLEAHGAFLEGIFDTPMVAAQELLWSGLCDTANGNRDAFSGSRGSLLVFTGSAANAPMKALALAYGGSSYANQDSLTRTVGTRQVAADDAFMNEVKPFASLRMRRLRPEPGTPSEVYVCRKVVRSRPDTDAVTLGWRMKYPTPELLKDGAKASADATKWPDRMRALGVFTPMLDASRAIKSLGAVVVDTPDPSVAPPEAVVEALCGVLHSFVAAHPDVMALAHIVDDTSVSKSAKKRGAKRRSRARGVMDAIRSKWTESSLRDLAATDSARVRDALVANTRARILERVSFYLSQAVSGARVVASPMHDLGLAIVYSDGTRTGPLAPRLPDFYALAFSAHATLVEARTPTFTYVVPIPSSVKAKEMRVPAFNCKLTALDDVPPAAEQFAVRVFGEFVRRNPEHTVMMCGGPHAAAAAAAVVGASVVEGVEPDGKRGLVRFVVAGDGAHSHSHSK
jgi:hypothetical protein